MRVGGSKNPALGCFLDRGLPLNISVACEKLIFRLLSGADSGSLLILWCPGPGVVYRRGDDSGTVSGVLMMLTVSRQLQQVGFSSQDRENVLRDSYWINNSYHHPIHAMSEVV